MYIPCLGDVCCARLVSQWAALVGCSTASALGNLNFHGWPPPAPKLLDRVRARIRTLHYSIRTEEAYVDWARRLILFHGKRHPLEMGAPEISAFLTYLAVERNVSASTQNQAKAALLFLYKEVLELELPWLDEVV